MMPRRAPSVRKAVHDFLHRVGHAINHFRRFEQHGMVQQERGFSGGSSDGQLAHVSAARRATAVKPAESFPKRQAFRLQGSDHIARGRPPQPPGRSHQPSL